MARAPTIQLIPFLKMTQTCNLKSHFGEVDNMQMICERTHDYILKTEANLFQNNWKSLEVFIISTNGPNFMKDQ